MLVVGNLRNTLSFPILYCLRPFQVLAKRRGRETRRNFRQVQHPAVTCSGAGIVETAPDFAVDACNKQATFARLGVLPSDFRAHRKCIRA